MFRIETFLWLWWLWAASRWVDQNGNIFAEKSLQQKMFENIQKFLKAITVEQKLLQTTQKQECHLFQTPVRGWSHGMIQIHRRRRKYHFSHLQLLIIFWIKFVWKIIIACCCDFHVWCLSLFCPKLADMPKFMNAGFGKFDKSVEPWNRLSGCLPFKLFKWNHKRNKSYWNQSNLPSNVNSILLTRSQILNLGKDRILMSVKIHHRKSQS